MLMDHTQLLQYIVMMKVMMKMMKVKEVKNFEKYFYLIPWFLGHIINSRKKGFIKPSANSETSSSSKFHKPPLKNTKVDSSFDYMDDEDDDENAECQRGKNKEKYLLDSNCLVHRPKK